MGYYDIVYSFLPTWVREKYGKEATYDVVRTGTKLYKLVIIVDKSVVAESDILSANGPMYWNGPQLAKLILSVK